MDVENGSSESSKAEQETLYLIYKYLDSLTPCKEASAKLKEELQRNFLLGDVHSWDGSHKKADIKDMDRKYSHVPNDMLLTLLRNSSAVEVPTKHSSIINCVSTSSKDPSVEDLSTYHDLVVRLSALSVDQSTHRTAIAKTEAKLRKLNDLIQLHTNFDYESNEGHPPEIDTSSFLTHLTAKDYEQIYAKDPSCDSTPSSQCLSKQQRTAELVSPPAATLTLAMVRGLILSFFAFVLWYAGVCHSLIGKDSRGGARKLIKSKQYGSADVHQAAGVFRARVPAECS